MKRKKFPDGPFLFEFIIVFKYTACALKLVIKHWWCGWSRKAG